MNRTCITIDNRCDGTRCVMHSPKSPQEVLDHVGLEILFHAGRGQEYGYGCYGKLSRDGEITIVFWPFDDADHASAAEAIREEPIEL